MQLLKQSTAATVLVGPVLDSAGLAITTAVIGDFQLTKNGSTAALASPATATHSHNGNYLIALSTGNTDTAGRLVITVNNSAQAMGTHRYTVLVASVFDAIVTNATNTTGGLPTATGTITALAGAVSTLTAGGVRTELATELGRIDATIGSRATQTSVDAIDDFIDTEVAAIKAKTDLIVAFPTNFSNLDITVGGAIAELGASALTANGAGDAIETYVWGALLANNTTANSFGARIIRSANSNNTVQITGGGSNHIFAVLHDAEPNSIPEDAFVDGALSARVIATDAIDSDAMAASANTEIANAVAATQALSRLDSMIESDGAGQFRFDTIAVSMVAGGAGGTDWTANERTAIRAIFGIPTSGTTPTDPTSGILDEIRDKTALITAGGTVNVSTPVTATGQLTSPLIIGDDYLAANGRRFRWTVELPSGYVIATSTARFGMRYEDDEGVNSFIKTGTVSDAGSGNVYLDFDLTKEVETGLLRPGWYEWSVEIVSGSGVKVTRVKSGKNVEWQEKQT
jgi:hypothetical protein